MRPKKYQCNESYFEVIDSSEKAYWLGLFYADLTVASDGKSNTPYKIIMCQAAEDLHIIESFKKSINATNPIRLNYKSRIKTQQDKYQLNIYSPKIASDLSKLGCTMRKSLFLKFPSENQVPTIFRKDFIRGYFDGDGSISYNDYYTNSKQNPQYLVRMTGTFDLLNGINEVLSKELDVSRKVIAKDKKANAFRFYLSGNSQVKKFYKYVYSDARYFLARKEEKMRGVLNLIIMERRKKDGNTKHSS